MTSKILNPPQTKTNHQSSSSSSPSSIPTNVEPCSNSVLYNYFGEDGDKVDDKVDADTDTINRAEDEKLLVQGVFLYDCFFVLNVRINCKQARIQHIKNEITLQHIKKMIYEIDISMSELEMIVLTFELKKNKKHETNHKSLNPH